MRINRLIFFSLICRVSFSSLDKYEMRAFDQAEKALSALNFNVTPEIQNLFDRLNFM